MAFCIGEGFVQMKLSPKRIQALRLLLKDELGLEFSDEELQLIGIAVVRFLIVKHRKFNEE